MLFVSRETDEEKPSDDARNCDHLQMTLFHVASIPRSLLQVYPALEELHKQNTCKGIIQMQTDAITIATFSNKKLVAGS